MLHNRKVARDFMLNTDRPTFLEIVYRAKVTPRQREILYCKFLDGHDNNFIADKLIVCPATVRNELEKAYDLLFKYLIATNKLPH